MKDQCIFKPCSIRDWTGRYGRIEGSQSIFRIKTLDGSSCLVITSLQDDSKGLCKAKDCKGIEALVSAVLAGKRKLGGGGGGSFQINEFGQVIVPASDGSGRRVLVGEIEGKLLFEDPFQKRSVIDLSDCSGLNCGDEWKLPYVGMPYNLHSGSKIYFFHIATKKSEYPPAQDSSLISQLRKIRRTGAARFIVNPYGLVITKKPPAGDWEPEESWEPVFVGRININLWFKKEN